MSVSLIDLGAASAAVASAHFSIANCFAEQTHHVRTMLLLHTLIESVSGGRGGAWVGSV